MTRLDIKLLLFLFILVALVLFLTIPRRREVVNRGSKFITLKRKTRKSKFYTLTQDGEELDNANGIPLSLGPSHFRINLLANNQLRTFSFLIHLRIICTKEQFRIIEERYESFDRELFYLSLNIQRTYDRIYPRIVCINVYSSIDELEWFGTSELIN